jgi:two-component system, NtrC family, sensor kinase
MAEKHDPPMVLVADDEVHTTLMLERIFEREGYQVQCANDGVTALNMAQKLLPDLILLDIQMPGMNGFDVLRGLREKKITATIPTILITAKAREPSDVAHGLNLGADDYLYKPFDPRELLARAESKMKSRQLEEKLQRRTQELQALLRVGEELNQSLAVNDLLELVLYLAMDLLPGSLAAIYQFDENQNLIASRVQANDNGESSAYNTERAIHRFLKARRSVLWPGEESVAPEFKSGMVVPIEHGDNLLGMLMLVTKDGEYDENHMRLFKGIGRQAALTLRNAQLHEIQANYAEHLHEMVVARTSELQSAQQMLIRSEKLASIGHLAASIAHEINNPLQPIRIHLEHMIEDLQNDDPIDQIAIENIQSSIERITRIVSQLLEFAGKRSTESGIQFLDLRRTLEGVINLNRKLFEQSGITLLSNLDQLPLIYGNKDQLEQVFMNIILNAQAATKIGGKLEIRARVEGSSIIIEFADTGCGIPADKINNIFDPFYSTKPNGTGLGLFVSYGIIQNHHGVIEVESKLNVGTTFIIQLPIDKQPES